MKISVIGTGYVGLTTGVCFAEMGHTVLCMDIDAAKIAALKKGISPIYEPGLEKLLKENIKNKRLNFTTSTKEAVEFGEVVFSAVGTPPDKKREPDLQFVKKVAEDFGKYLSDYKIFVNKSTVPVGTGDLCKKIIEKELANRGIKIPFDAVSNPEFLREGSAIHDTLHPDRIVIGCESVKSKNLMKTLYRRLKTELIFTDLKTAEIIKYAANSFLATKISFINEVANFCELAGGNIKTISRAIGLDDRIGKKFLNAGIGYGGSCFPKDVDAFIASAKKYGQKFQIIDAAQKVNLEQKERLFHKLKEVLPSLKNKHIALWGLAFKPGTDDIREAPSLTIIDLLLKAGAHISTFDPAAIENVKKIRLQRRLSFSKNPYEAAKNADALLVVTEWDDFKKANLKKVKSAMSGSLILDGRNVLDKKTAEKLGFKYFGIGI